MTAIEDFEKGIDMSDIDPQAQAEIQAAPMPTPSLLKRRKNVPYQVIRFFAINLKMIRVIRSSHHG